MRMLHVKDATSAKSQITTFGIINFSWFFNDILLEVHTARQITWKFNIYRYQSSVSWIAQSFKNALFPVTDPSGTRMALNSLFTFWALWTWGPLGSRCSIRSLGAWRALDSRIALISLVSFWSRVPLWAGRSRSTSWSRGSRHSWHTWHSGGARAAMVPAVPARSTWWCRVSALNGNKKADKIYFEIVSLFGARAVVFLLWLYSSLCPSCQILLCK